MVSRGFFQIYVPGGGGGKDTQEACPGECLRACPGGGGGGGGGDTQEACPGGCLRACLGGGEVEYSSSLSWGVFTACPGGEGRRRILKKLVLGGVYVPVPGARYL